ncbi:MAG: hypothetical protein U0165_00885 [Polyangiaceae bacterium]
MKLTWSTVPLLAGLALSSIGCGHSAYNVRAFRAYATEDAKFSIVVDRIGDMAASLLLIDEMLLATPYTPGDDWVSKLPLNETEFARLKEQIANEEPYKGTSFQIPVIKVYRKHLREVLDEAKSFNANRTAKFPSLMEGIGSLKADGELKTKLEEYRKSIDDAEAAKKKFEEEEAAYEKSYNPNSRQPVPQSYSDAKEALKEAKKKIGEAEKAVLKAFDNTISGSATAEDSGSITKDGLTALSVAMRLDLESLALIPILVVKAARSLPSALAESAQDSLKEAANDPTGGALKGLDKLSNLPSYAYVIEDRLDRQANLIEGLTERLAKLRATAIEQTPGMALRESALDAVVGVTLDSLRVSVKAGGEGFFFNQLSSKSGNDTTNSGSSAQSDQKQGTSVVNDYTGRTRRVVYDVKPIWLAAGKIDVNLDWTHIPNAGNISFGYKTSFASGGNIDTNGSLSKELGVTGAASSVLDFGLGILGVKSSFRTATFTSGTIRVLSVDRTTDKDTGRVVATAPLQFQFQQIEVGYDLAFLMNEFAGRWYIEEFTLAFKKFDYTLPRIVYELEKDPTKSNSSTEYYSFRRQSRVQKMTSEYYMGGLNVRFGPGEGSRFAIFGDLGMFFGGGPTQFKLPKSTVIPTSGEPPKSPSENFTGNALAVDLTLSAGARYRFASPGSRLRLYVEALYLAELIGAQTDTQDEKTNAAGQVTQQKRKVEFGGADVFHGPRLNLLGSFLKSTPSDGLAQPRNQLRAVSLAKALS